MTWDNTLIKIKPKTTQHVNPGGAMHVSKYVNEWAREEV
jgi:hypothetical protein